MTSYKTVDDYINDNEKWEEALHLLRDLLLETGMEETIKWGIPAYTLNNQNVIGLAAFKAYVGIWFHQGVFLTDLNQKLLNAQKGVTKAMRQWRFTSKEEIINDITIIRQYLQEAVMNQQEGKIMQTNRNKPLIIPNELRIILDKNIDLKAAFEQFSLYKKREFADYISGAKRTETKLRRLEKIRPMILEGIGLGDKYRK